MNNNIEHILDQNDVDKVKFYYRGAPLLNNAFTTCLFINSQAGRIEARGVSICSVKDTFCKKEGKQKAFGRAIKALVRKANDGKINATGRDSETVRRTFKLRESALGYFEHVFLPDLMEINPQTVVKEIVLTGSKGGRKYFFDIPLSYPIRIANMIYKYKSQYRPNPAGREEATILMEASDPIVLKDAIVTM